MGDSEPEVFSGPLEERLEHKSWKCRKAAYEEVAKLFKSGEPEDDCFRKHSSSLSRFVTDSNAVAQEAGLSVLIEFLNANFQSSDNRLLSLAGSTGELAEKLVEKGISSSKPKTALLSKEALVLLVQVENKGDAVVEALLSKGTAHKVPKTRIASYASLRELFASFGPKTVPLKPVLERLEKGNTFADSDAKVRGEAVKLLATIHSFVGPLPLSSLKETLRPAQQKELETEFAKEEFQNQKASKQTRAQIFKAQQAAAQADSSSDPTASNNSNNAGEALEEEEEAIDPLELIPEVDVFGKLDSNFFTQINEKSWKEKKAALEGLLAIIETPKLKADSQFGEMSSILCKLITDTNLLVATLSIKAIGLLAKGLRAEFSNYARQMVEPLLGKFKEKKPSIVTEINTALDNIFLEGKCIPFESTLEEIKETAFKNKNPNVKSCAMLLCERMCSKGFKVVTKTSLGKAAKSLLDALVKQMDDPNGDVREASFKAAGALIWLCGERGPTAGALDEMDKHKVPKVKEHIETLGPAPKGVAAAPKVPPTTKPPPKKSAPPKAEPDEDDSAAPPPPRTFGQAPPKRPKAAPAENNDSGDAPAAPKRAFGEAPPKRPKTAPESTSSGDAPKRAFGEPPPKREKTAAPSSSSSNSSSKVVPKSTGGKAAPAKSSGGGGGGGGKDDDADFSSGGMSQDDAQNKWEAVVPENVRTLLASKAWKERVEGMESLESFVEDCQELSSDAALPEALFRFLKFTPGFKESNFQVFSKMFDVFAKIASAADLNISKRACAVVLPILAEKIGDIKLKTPSANCLMVFAELLGPGFVCAQTFKVFAGHKVPKTTAAGIDFALALATEFGGQNCPIKTFLSFLQEVLESTNPAIKKSAIQLIVFFRRAVGPPFRDLIAKDVKPPLLSTIDSELGKVPDLDDKSVIPEPTRTLRGPAGASAGPSGKKGGSGGGGGGSGFDLPRNDISGQLTASLLAKLSDSSWKVKAEGLKEVNDIVLGAGKLIQPSLGQLPQALKKLLGDQNKVIVSTTLQLLALLANAAGAGITPQSKVLLPAILASFSDMKKNIREEVGRTMDAWAQQTSLEPIVPHLPKPLETQGVGRPDTLQWSIKQIRETSKPLPANALTILAKPAVACLQDKAGDVRKLAEQLIELVIKNSGYHCAKNATKDLKPAVHKTVMSILEKYEFATDDSPAPASNRSHSSNAPPPPMDDELSAPPPEPSAHSPKPKLSLDDDKENRPETAPPLRKQTRRPSLLGSKLSGSTNSALPKVSSSSSSASSASGPRLAFLANTKKEARSRANDKKLKWQLWDSKDAPKEHLELVREQLSECVHADVVLLLSNTKDFNPQLEGLKLLEQSIPSQTPEMIQSLDVLFKWVSLRLSETNVKMLLESLHFLQVVFDTLKEEPSPYQFSEYEAGILFPFLVDKIGNANSQARSSMRSLLQTVYNSNLYPSRALFVFLSAGLNSKNSKTRLEVLEEMRDMTFKYSIQKLLPLAGSKPNKIMINASQLVADRDAIVRNAALGFLTAAYVNNLQQDIWPVLSSSLPANIKAQLEDKIAKMPKTEKTLPVLAHEPEPLPESHTNNNNNANDDEVEISVSPSDSQQTQFRELEDTTLRSHLNDLTGFDVLASPRNERQALLRDLISILDNEKSTEDSKIETLKKLCDAFSAWSEDCDLLDTHELPLGQVARTLARHIRIAFDEATSLSLVESSEASGGAAHIPVRLVKHLLNALMTLFAQRDLVRFIDSDSLEAVIKSLLKRLLDGRLPELQEGATLLKALNSIMLRILENANRAHSFCALLDIMGTAYDSGQNQRFMELVVKCLLKLTKALPTSIATLGSDLDVILSQLHIFLTQHPPSLFKDRDDLPLRTVKTILNEIVKAKGEAIRDHLNLIQSDNKAPLLISYIELMLKNNKAQQQTTPPAPASSQQLLQNQQAQAQHMQLQAQAQASLLHQQLQSQPPVQMPPNVDLSSNANSNSEPMSDAMKVASLEAELDSVFTKIRHREETALGIQLLVKLMNENPEADFESYFASRCSPPFLQYIKRQIAKQQQLDSQKAGSPPKPSPSLSPNVSQASRLQEKKKAAAAAASTGPAPRPQTAPSGGRGKSADDYLKTLQDLRSSYQLPASGSASQQQQQQPQPQPSRSPPTSQSLDMASLRERIQHASSSSTSSHPPLQAKSGNIQPNPANGAVKKTNPSTASGKDSLDDIRQRIARIRGTGPAHSKN